MTIREIANLAGLAPSTVHRAINTPDKVKPEILKLINKILSETNLEEINLKKLYIVLPFAYHVYMQFIIDLTTALNKYDIEIIPFITNENKKKEHDFISSIPFSSKIGLIWSPTDPDSDYSFLHRTKNKPIVIFLKRKLNINNPNPHIILDIHSALNIAVDELHRNGNSSILFINGAKEESATRNRDEGFLAAIENYNIDKYAILHSDFYNWRASYQVLSELSDEIAQYDAIISGGELVSYGIIKRLRESNIEIPKDMRLITIGNSYALESQAISSIYFLIEQIVNRIVKILLERSIDNTNTSTNYYIAPHTYLRGSESK